MEEGDVLGHEFMGIVEETGSEVHNSTAATAWSYPSPSPAAMLPLQKEVLVGLRQHQSECAPDGRMYGYSGSGLFGYSHMMGGYAGGQAQYVRVPFANVGALKIESDLPDEKVLFLSDIFPTGYRPLKMRKSRRRYGRNLGMRARRQFAIASAFLLGAGRVIAIDRIPERLEWRGEFGAITVDYRRTSKRVHGTEGSDRRSRPRLLH